MYCTYVRDQDCRVLPIQGTVQIVYNSRLIPLPGRAGRWIGGAVTQLNVLLKELGRMFIHISLSLSLSLLILSLTINPVQVEVRFVRRLHPNHSRQLIDKFLGLTSSPCRSNIIHLNIHDQAIILIQDDQHRQQPSPPPSHFILSILSPIPEIMQPTRITIAMIALAF